MDSSQHSDLTLPEPGTLKLIKDRYVRSRGGTSEILKISCARCGTVAGLYQKDGPGNLLRCYKDRFHFPEALRTSMNLVCAKCNLLLGADMIYKPESRPAFRLFRCNFRKENYK